jgi:uncharacterized membrane protein
MQKTSFDTRRMVGIALLIAIIVALQMVAAFVKVGPVSITLSLVPIVVGAAIYGAAAGGILGAALGVVVIINCITGIDAGGQVLWLANPFLTIVLCLVKSGAAGMLAGLIYKTVSVKNTYIGVICAAVVCPVVNTGIFLIGMMLFYMDMLVAWAGGTNVLYFAIFGLAGVNFLLELAVNIVLSPAIMRIINAVRKA